MQSRAERGQKESGSSLLCEGRKPANKADKHTPGEVGRDDKLP